MKPVFKRNSSIGNMDAESDEKYLADCFFETGDLQVLEDTSDPKRIVVGRVGAGKSALLARLRDTNEHAFEIRAETLSLNYVANSEIIQFFTAAGVKLDLFYQLLWRHLFAVELLQRRYKLTAADSSSVIGAIFDKLKPDSAKSRALRYLQSWGDKFWQDTEVRVREFTLKLEDKLKAGLGATAAGLTLDASGAQTLSEEVRTEIAHRAQAVVNANQVRELTEILDFLEDEVFDDPMKRYYLVIDRLDEGWVDDRLRYQLIRALIETIRAFQRVRSVKIIISMREDLLRNVFALTQAAGFQEEKYESLYLRLKWKKGQLKDLLDLRISKMFREQYTQRTIKFDDIFRNTVRGQQPFDYVIERSLQRPRDVIAFVNCCIELSEDKETISPTSLQEAEQKYSLGRLRSLTDEWHTEFPSLAIYTDVLRRRQHRFRLDEIDEKSFMEFLSERMADLSEADAIYRGILAYLESKKTSESLKIQLMKILYLTSVIGIKPLSTDRVAYAHSNDSGLSDGQYAAQSSVFVNPMLWKALDIVIPPRAVKDRGQAEPSDSA